jgi:hypothetical protein
MLQADIYQVQNRLDALSRGSAQDGSMPRKASRRRGQIDAIKSTTGEVEAILARTTHPLDLRIQLSEHLCGLQMELECIVLKQTDHLASRPFLGLDTKSLTRLTPWSALMDRILNLGASSARDSGSTFREQKSTVLPPTKEKIAFAGSAAHDCVEELHDLLDLLELDLSLDADDAEPAPNRGRNTEKDTLQWLEQATGRLSDIQDEGIMPLLKLRERAREHAESLRIRMGTLQEKYSTKLKPVQERSKELQAELKIEREQSYGENRAEEKRCEALRGCLRKLETQAREYKAAAGKLEIQGTTQITDAWNWLRIAEGQQNEVARTHGETAEINYKELQALESRFAEDRACASHDITALRKQLACYRDARVPLGKDSAVSLDRKVEVVGDEDIVVATHSLLEKEMGELWAMDKAGLRREAARLEVRNQRLHCFFDTHQLWTRQAQKQRRLDPDNLRRDLTTTHEELQHVMLWQNSLVGLSSRADGAEGEMSLETSDQIAEMRKLMQMEMRGLQNSFEIARLRLGQGHDRIAAIENERIRETLSMTREVGRTWRYEATKHSFSGSSRLQ